MSVGRGEFLAMLGPNGAGKTTFLKLLSGIITPTRGSARVMGHVPWDRADDFRRRFALGYGPKKPALVGPTGSRKFQASPRNLSN